MAELTWPEFAAKAKAGTHRYPAARCDRAARAAPRDVGRCGVCRRRSASASRSKIGGARRPDDSLRLQVAAALGRWRGVSGHDEPRRQHLLARRARRDPRPRAPWHPPDRGAERPFRELLAGGRGLDLGLRELRRDGITDMQAMRLEYWDFVEAGHARQAVSRRASRAPSSSMPACSRPR